MAWTGRTTIIQATPEMMSIDEVTEYLGVSRQTIRNWRMQGKLGYYQLNRRIVFRRDEVDQFLLARRVPARKEAE